MMRGGVMRTSLHVGVWDAAGAAAGSLIGLWAAGAAARAFGDFFQFYHFTLVVASISTGVAASNAARHVIDDNGGSAKTGIIAGSLVLAFFSGLVAGVLASEFFARDFAIAAWGITGGLLGLTLAFWFEDLDPLPASCGGLCAGLVSGWLFFDPFANTFELTAEAAGFGFSLGIARTVADSVLGSHAPPVTSSARDGRRP